MTPGRKYRPEDLLAILWGYKWLLLAPLALAALGMAAYARTLPNVYHSEVVVQVVPQGIPENFVRSTVTTQVATRLTTIAQQILSRARLEALIVELNLYPEVRRVGTMQDAVEQMQRDITGPALTTDRRSGGGRQRNSSSGSFVLGFTSGNPETALKVTERLASMFIEENLRQRTGQAEVTDRFLESQLESMRVELQRHESRLAEFNQKFGASLPKQLGANTTGLQAVQNQITSLVEKVILDRERRLLLEGQIASLEGMEIIEAVRDTAALRGATPGIGGAGRTGVGAGATQRSAAGGSPAGGGARSTRSGGGVSPIRPGDGGRDEPGSQLSLDPASGTAAQRLERARSILQNLELRLTAEHPDVKIARRQISELEKLAEEEALQAPLSASSTVAGLSPAELKRNLQVKALRDEMDLLDRQIARRETEEKALREKLAVYQRRLEETPLREAELTALTRDYDNLQGQYDMLLRKRSDSKLATELEHRQIAEQFRIVEPPRLPQRPSSPDRPRLVMLGALGGLGFGLLIAGLFEYRDRSFKTDEDVIAALSLPVLAIVPTMVTSIDRRRQTKRRFVLTGSALALALLSFAAWKFQIFTSWLS